MTILDKIYRWASYAAGVLILLICLLISAQITLNIFSRIAPGVLPSTIPSYANFAGYMLAAASFLALADTLRSGSHIRVALLTDALPMRARFFAEALSLLIALGFAGFATWWMGHLVAESARFGDVSSGIVSIPLWIPQSCTTAGMALVTIAILHTLVDLVRKGRPLLKAADEV
jgi:TRAP-type C4-dicarboxylate transport system permease small subunit